MRRGVEHPAELWELGLYHRDEALVGLGIGLQHGGVALIGGEYPPQMHHGGHRTSLLCVSSDSSSAVL